MWNRQKHNSKELSLHAAPNTDALYHYTSLQVVWLMCVT